jgi:hypothetical protein
MCDTQTGNLVCTGVVEKQFKLTDDITEILHEHTTGFLKIPDPEIMNQHTLPINVLLFLVKKDGCYTFMHARAIAVDNYYDRFNTR